MPTGLKELGIKEEELETLAEMCSFGKTRELPAIRKLAYEDMLNIYRMAYEAD